MAQPAAVSTRDKLRARIQVRAAANVAAKKVNAAAKKFATLRRIAVEEPQEVDAALSQLAEGFSELSEALHSMSQNLDLGGGLPATASLKARVAAKRNYASRLRRIAEEAPEQVEMAFSEVYQALDGLAEDMENAAGNLGFELVPATTPEEVSAEAAPFGGEESPAEEHAEAPTEAPAESPDAEEDEHEASGSDWFVTDRDEVGTPKAPTTASVRKPVVQVRK